MKKERSGFTFIDVLVSIVLLLICSLLLSLGMSRYNQNLHFVKANHRMDSLVQDEILLLRHTGSYQNRSIENIILEYELLEEKEFNGERIWIVKLNIEDKDYAIKKEYILAVEEK